MTSCAELDILSLGESAELSLRAGHVRPLGPYSNFIVEDLGRHNEHVREAHMPATSLEHKLSSRLENVPDEVLEALIVEPSGFFRRTALLDLVFGERSMCIAYGSSAEYRARRSSMKIFQWAEALAEAEGRHPLLSWSDVAIHHPSVDPRSFLTPGEDRDQEILMYRIQGGIERVFNDLICAFWDHDAGSLDDLISASAAMDRVLHSMIHLSRVRRIGQFYKLDPFLGPNGDVRGHATGAFSVWSFVMGVLLTGNGEFINRLCDPENRQAFDPDALPYVDRVQSGDFTVLQQTVQRRYGARSDYSFASVLAEDVASKFRGFLMAHRGAMRKHARGAFEDDAPSRPDVTNLAAIKEAISNA
jgi:hypothetical protein